MDAESAVFIALRKYLRYLYDYIISIGLPHGVMKLLAVDATNVVSPARAKPHKLIDNGTIT